MIRTRPATKEYLDGWDQVFGKRSEDPIRDLVVESEALGLYATAQECAMCHKQIDGGVATVQTFDAEKRVFTVCVPCSGATVSSGIYD